MGKKSSVLKNLALITQMGLNMMVPIFLCLFIGIWVGKLVGVWVVIPFLLLGMAAGMRNCYIMAMNASGANKKKEVQEDGQFKEDR